MTSAKIQSKNSTARFKTSAGAERWVFLSGAGRAPLSEGGRDARGRRGERRGGGSLREPGAALTGRHGHHSPAAAGTPLTAGVSRIPARRDAAAPPVSAGKRLGRPSPGRAVSPPTSRSRVSRLSGISPCSGKRGPFPWLSSQRQNAGRPLLEAPQGFRVLGGPSRDREDRQG